MPAHYFADFEADGGWTAGPLSAEEGSALRLVQGEAAVVVAPEKESFQILELKASSPSTAVFVDATPLAGNDEVFCELLARPFAVDESSDEELLDFAGAILGFFRAGDRGEIRALFSQTATESVWISTGLQFELDANGVAAHWLRITVRLEPATGRWALAINGSWQLAGLRAVELAADSVLPLWLYGHESHGNRFDDVLLSSVEPDELERMIARKAATERRLAAAGSTARKAVTQGKPTSELRRMKPPDPASRDRSPVLRGLTIALDTGARVYRPPVRPDDSGPSITAYAPAYDAEGNVLPAVITITADAELRPGVDLSLLRWSVRELKGLDDFGAVVGEGDFRSGLVQTFTLTPEWVRKATAVIVSTVSTRQPDSPRQGPVEPSE